ncbi:hypothetical protein LCGC14_2498800 [marine sediment metagenome]|uniref:Uncharacterized protein n=1 Tax=marine sediment metagenome TaxID=412755 RepID=A0A0F9B2E1_9ZZZZ
MEVENNKFLMICDYTCSCEFCGEKIRKGERYLHIWKNAWKGATRTNICKSCILKIFVELAPDKKEVENIRKELILNNLEN